MMTDVGRHDSKIAASEPSALRREAPDEVLQPITDEEYKELRLMTDMREPFRIPGEYMLGCKHHASADLATTPLIAFINGRSGGHVGPRLLTVLSRSLGQAQVFDLSEDTPVHVLSTLWANLKKREAEGDVTAGRVRRHLRILAAGGDGTVTWILKTIFDLGLDPPPAVAVLPLGTGNDLSLSFGWGNAFLNAWIKSEQLYRTLGRYVEAEPRALDAWRIVLSGPGTELFHDLPHSLGATTDDMQGAATGIPGEAVDDGVAERGTPAAGHSPSSMPRATSAVGGMFWNYFSVGLDAQAAYGFHSLRERHGWAASTRLANQAWYSYFSCSSGWFCGASPLRNRVQLRGRGGPGGDAWRDVPVPASVRAIIVLNLQSYGGGRDVWGLAQGGRPGKRVSPIFSDGLVEVVGFRDGWHTALVMGQLSPRIHAIRIAQLAELELVLRQTGRGGVADDQGLTYMQLDGEPWPQAIPAPSAGNLKVAISRAGQSAMLMNARDVQGPAGVRSLAKRGAENGAALS